MRKLKNTTYEVLILRAPKSKTIEEIDLKMERVDTVYSSHNMRDVEWPIIVDYSNSGNMGC